MKIIDLQSFEFIKHLSQEKFQNLNDINYENVEVDEEFIKIFKITDENIKISKLREFKLDYELELNNRFWTTLCFETYSIDKKYLCNTSHYTNLLNNECARYYYISKIFNEDNLEYVLSNKTLFTTIFRLDFILNFEFINKFINVMREFNFTSKDFNNIYSIFNTLSVYSSIINYEEEQIRNVINLNYEII